MDFGHGDGHGFIRINFKRAGQHLFIGVRGPGHFEQRGKGIHIGAIRRKADHKATRQVIDRVDKKAAIGPQAEAVTVGGSDPPEIMLVFNQFRRQDPGGGVGRFGHIVIGGHQSGVLRIFIHFEFVNDVIAIGVSAVLNPQCRCEGCDGFSWTG